ncbi:hypothetical protein ACFLUU_06440 [Chloroflexota bacterium]
MEQTETTTSAVKTITPKELASKLGINPKRVRIILRAQFPRVTKNKNWEIPLDVAKKVEKAYKASQQKKKAEIKKELESA